ncbi:MAG: hypothetical protein HYV07_06430 [Deltaproteobacteria bacterium]|nr:hypothetical protein [Deltaproteobacteria bacterium]
MKIHAHAARRWLFVTLLGLTGSWATLADAAPGTGESPSFAEMVERGMERYRAKDFKAAIDIFYAALELWPEPKLIFNIARCYDQMGDDEEALRRYNQFVANPASTPPDRAKALNYVSEIRGRQLAAARAASSSRAATREEVKVAEAPPPAADRLHPWVTFSGIGLSAVLGGLTVWSGLDALSSLTTYRADPTDEQWSDGINGQKRTNALAVGTVVVTLATLALGIFATDWGAGL